MGTTKFIIRSDGESLAHWLQANWRAPAGNPATASDGQAWLQPPTWNPEQRQITAGAWVTGEAAAHGPAIPEVIRFDLLPLGDGRLEVVVTCEPLFDVFLADLLIEMGKRWPEVSSPLRRAPAGNEEPAPEPGQPEPARAATYPYSLTLEDEDKLRELWADDSMSKKDIAKKLGIGEDRLDQYKDKYQLPDRRRGRKPVQKST